MIKGMSERMDYYRNVLFRRCLDKKEYEALHYLLCDCPVLEERKLQCFGRYSFCNLESFLDFALMNILRFVKRLVSNYIQLFSWDEVYQKQVQFALQVSDIRADCPVLQERRLQ